MEWKIAVLDDDKLFLHSFTNQLQSCCSDLGFQAIITAYDSEKSLMDSLCANNPPDILFCDILLQKSNGVRFADMMQWGYPQIKVVFVTAVAANVVEIFQANPSHFLVKPISVAQLCNVLITVVKKIEKERSQENLLSFSFKGQVCVVRKNLLEYVEIKNRKLAFHECGKEIFIPGQMDELEAQLGPGFFRCHKSYLVNLRYVRRLEGGALELFSGNTIPIARKRLAETKHAFFDYAHRHAVQGRMDAL